MDIKVYLVSIQCMDIYSRHISCIYIENSVNLREIKQDLTYSAREHTSYISQYVQQTHTLIRIALYLLVYITTSLELLKITCRRPACCPCTSSSCAKARPGKRRQKAWKCPGLPSAMTHLCCLQLEQHGTAVWQHRAQPWWPTCAETLFSSQALKTGRILQHKKTYQHFFSPVSCCQGWGTTFIFPMTPHQSSHVTSGIILIL